jgi:hypothetical protein
MRSLAAEVRLEPLERAFGIVVQQDPHQLEQVLVFKDEIHHFTHVVTLRLAYVEAYVEALVVSADTAVAIVVPVARIAAGVPARLLDRPVDEEFRAAWLGFKQLYVDLCERYRAGYGR